MIFIYTMILMWRKKSNQKKDSGKKSSIKKTIQEKNEISNYKTKNYIRTPTKYPSKKIKENKNNTKEIYFENETYIHLLDSENTECGINESQFFQGERKSEISPIKNEQSLDGENYYKTIKKEKKKSIEKYEEKKSSEIDVPKDTSYLYNNLNDQIDPSKFIYIGNKNTGERNIQILPNLRNNDIRNIDNLFGSNEKSYMGKKRQNSQNIEQVENTIKEGLINDDRNSSSKEKDQNVNMNIKLNDHQHKKFTIIDQNKKTNNFITNIVFEIGDHNERSKEKSNNEDHHLNEKIKQNENKDVNALNGQKVNEVIKEDDQKAQTLKITEKKNSKKIATLTNPSDIGPVFIRESEFDYYNNLCENDVQKEPEKKEKEHEEKAEDISTVLKIELKGKEENNKSREKVEDKSTSFESGKKDVAFGNNKFNNLPNNKNNSLNNMYLNNNILIQNPQFDSSKVIDSDNPKYITVDSNTFFYYYNYYNNNKQKKIIIRFG